MQWTLEVVRIPVADVDSARRYYEEGVGFAADHDVSPADGVRVVQLTPPGSGCSIVLGTGIGESAAPGSARGMQLVVADVEAARAALLERGVEVSEVQRVAPGDGGAFVYFVDPDGNAWAIQEISARG